MVRLLNHASVRPSVYVRLCLSTRQLVNPSIRPTCRRLYSSHLYVPKSILKSILTTVRLSLVCLQQCSSCLPSSLPLFGSSTQTFILPSVNQFLRPSIRPLKGTSILPSTDASIRPAVGPTVHPSIYPFVSPSFRPFVVRITFRPPEGFDEDFLSRLHALSCYLTKVDLNIPSTISRSGNLNSTSTKELISSVRLDSVNN